MNRDIVIEEDESTGITFVTIDGVKYELEDLECEECGWVKDQDVADALEEFWTSALPCPPAYVEVCSCPKEDD